MAVVEGKWIGCLRDIGDTPQDFEDQLQMLRRPKPPVPADPITVPKDPIPPLPPDNGSSPCGVKKGIPVILQVMVIDMLQPDTSRNDVVEVPTLMALFKTANASETNVVFTSGLFDETNGHVQLSSTPVIAIGGSSGVAAPTTMRLDLTGDVLSGEFLAPQKFGKVEFHRAKK